MIRPIYTYGEHLLTLPAIDIEKCEAEFIQKTYIPDMFETMHNANGIGLASPQLGHNWKIIVVDVEIGEGTNFKGAFINPKILSYSGGMYIMSEGCLSIPGVNARVVRPFTIDVEYYDENFVKHHEIFGGIKSRVLQHEIDHLNGKLFIDRLDLDAKSRMLISLMKIKNKKVNTRFPIV